MHRHPLNKTTYLILGAALLAANLAANFTLAADDKKVPAAPSPEEKAAIAAIEKIGGTVRPVSADTDLKDVDFHLSGTGLTDEGLAQVKQLKNVVWLNLKGTKITDAGLANLAELKSLKQLHLEMTGIGDTGLAHLAGLENLEYLNLYGTKTTDAGLKSVAGLKNLKKVYIWQTPVTDATVAEVTKARPGLQVVGAAVLKPVTPLADKKEQDKKAAKTGPPKKTLAKGQFVRVRLPGKARILSLAEVQVHKTGDGAELQKGGTATQASTGFGGAPERAIDGKTDGNYEAGSVTHTNDQDDPWWMVDLKGPQDIGRIVIFNRSENGERLEGAVIEVLDPAQKVIYTETIKDATGGSVHPFEAK
ncbi:MAG: hypothetical protein K8T91_03335 [Planctomycetes bacterium]|nr:hypothetical protein [Planctomycetota bacterium]